MYVKKQVKKLLGKVPKLKNEQLGKF